MASPAETRRVEQHIGACDDCRDALQWMQATRIVISERPVALPPADMRLRIARAIASSSDTPVPVFSTRRSLVLRPAIWAAAASLAIMGLVVESLTKPPLPAHPIAPTVVATTANTRPTPNVWPAPVKQIAHNTPSSVHPQIHAGTSLLVAKQPPVTLGPSHAAARVSHSTTSNLLRMANTLPPLDQTSPTSVHSPTRPAPLAVKHGPPVTLPRIATRVEDSTPSIMPIPAPKPEVVAIIPQPTPSRLPSSVALPVVPTPAPAAPVVVAHADAPESVPTRTVHSDLLSSVKIKVASLNEGSVKVYRNSYAPMQVVAYDAGNERGKFVQQPITYGYISKQ